MSQQYRAVSIIFVLLAISNVANSQAPDRDVQLATARELIQMGREDAIKEEMRFTAEQADAFWPLYKEYRAELGTVQDRYLVMVVDYVGDYYDYKLTDQDAERILKEYFSIRKDILKIRESYVRKFRKILSPASVMRLYQLENKIEAEVNVAIAQSVPLMESE
jgi:hypothetical protein